MLDAWSKRLRGRNFITCEDIDIPAINRELAYISLLGCEDGEFRFRLKARNGEIIAVSEGYKAKASCMNGIESVKKNAPEAQRVEVEDK